MLNIIIIIIITIIIIAVVMIGCFSPHRSGLRPGKEAAPFERGTATSGGALYRRDL